MAPKLKFPGETVPSTPAPDALASAPVPQSTAPNMLAPGIPAPILPVPQPAANTHSAARRIQSISTAIPARSDAGNGAAGRNAAQRHAAAAISAAADAAAAVCWPIHSWRSGSTGLQSAVSSISGRWRQECPTIFRKLLAAPNAFPPMPTPPGGMPGYYPQQGAMPGYAGNDPPQGMLPQAMPGQPMMPQAFAPQPAAPAASPNFLDDVLSGPSRGGSSPMDELGFGDSGNASSATVDWQPGNSAQPGPVAAEQSGYGQPPSPAMSMDFDASAADTSQHRRAGSHSSSKRGSRTMLIGGALAAVALFGGANCRGDPVEQKK